jgi:hypothetical protein
MADRDEKARARDKAGNRRDVAAAEDPHQVYGRLNENAGLPVRFDAHYGSKTTVVYVNPGQVTYFEETPAFEGRVGPFVEHG